MYKRETNEGIEQTTRRTEQYWFIDGLAEITIGLLFLFLGLVFWVATLLPEGKLISLLPIVLIPLVFLLGRPLRQGLDAIKGRITYPRTGYVAFRRKPANRKVAWTLGLGLMAFLMVAIIKLGSEVLAWTALMDGLLGGFVLLAIGRGLSRFNLLAGLSVLIGAGLSLAGLSADLGHTGYYSLTGLALLVSGALTLRRYLAANPEPDKG